MTEQLFLRSIPNAVYVSGPQLPLCTWPLYQSVRVDYTAVTNTPQITGISCLIALCLAVFADTAFFKINKLKVCSNSVLSDGVNTSQQ